MQAGEPFRCRASYDQLPIMLEGENKRFVLNSIDPKAHYEKYQRDFVWLVDAGVALKADIVTEPKSPLLKTARPSQFKLYQSDTGMLMARYPAGVAQAAYLDSKEPNLGGIYENVVAQQLAAQNRQALLLSDKSAVKWTLWSMDRMGRLFRSRLNRAPITTRTLRSVMCLIRLNMA